MRRAGALGALFVLGVLLMWSGSIGSVGAMLGSVLCPAQLIVLKREERGKKLPHETAA